MRKSGFTFIEIAIVISILLIVLAMGIPAFIHHHAERDLEATQRQLQSLFIQARQASLNQAPTDQSQDLTKPQNGCKVSFLSVGPPIHCQVIDPAGNVLQDFTGPTTVQLTQLPGGGAQTDFQYDSMGKFTTNAAGQNNVGQFKLGSTSTNTVLSFTTYLTTGGVSIP